MFSDTLAKLNLIPPRLPIFQMGNCATETNLLNAMQTLPVKLERKTTAALHSSQLTAGRGFSPPSLWCEQNCTSGLLCPGEHRVTDARLRCGAGGQDPSPPQGELARGHVWGCVCHVSLLRFSPLGQPLSPGPSACHLKHLLKSLWTSRYES